MRTTIKAGLCVLFLARAVMADPAGFSLATTGLRWGLAANERSRELNSARAFITFDLPWEWQWGKGWRLQTQLGGEAGWLGGRGDDAFVGSAGPAFLVERKGIPLSLELGVSPTVLSRHTFGRLDLGTSFQVTSHAGLNWEVSRRVGVGYRFEHLSNVHLSSQNPGLNLHLFSFRYRF